MTVIHYLLLGAAFALVVGPPLFAVVAAMAVGVGKVLWPQEFQPGWFASLRQDLRRRGE